MLAATFTGSVGTTEVSISLPSAKTLLVIGPNGAGKSSMFRMLLGLIRPHTGRIQLHERCLFDSTAGICVPTEQRRIGFMPQSYALFPQMTAIENVAFGLECLGLRRAERLARAGALLEELGVSRLSERLPAQLSGGEAQRVALARALAPSPRALLLDEPMAALDRSTRRHVRKFLAPYLAASELPTVVISHDPDDAGVLGQYIAVIENGVVVQHGSIDELRSSPATAFVESFVARGSGSEAAIAESGSTPIQRASRAPSSRPSFVGGAGI
jgi:molybdate transport system ATP-binding protein